MMLSKRLNTKVNGIITKKFVSKPKYGRDRSAFEYKISKIDKKYLMLTDLVTKTSFNTKVTEIKGNIASITGLATT